MLSREILEADHVTVVDYDREWIRVRLGLLPAPILLWVTRSDRGFTAHASHLVRLPDGSALPFPDESFGSESEAAVSAIRHLAAEFHRAANGEPGHEPTFAPHEDAPSWVPNLADHVPGPSRPSIDNFLQFDFDGETSKISNDQAGLDRFLAVMSTRNEVLLNIGTLFTSGGPEFDQQCRLFFLMGCIARTMQLLDGFVEAVSRKQIFVAGSLLRLNLDTYLRLMAKDLVIDKEKFFRRVFDGEQINRMKNLLNEQLTDKTLVKEAGKRDPWIPRVYDRTSGYIHLSATHCYGIISSEKEGDALRVNLQVGARSETIPLDIWFEMVQGFDHVLMLIAAELQRMGIDDRRKRMGPNAILTTRTRAAEILKASKVS